MKCDCLIKTQYWQHSSKNNIETFLNESVEQLITRSSSTDISLWILWNSENSFLTQHHQSRASEKNLSLISFFDKGSGLANINVYLKTLRWWKSFTCQIFGLYHNFRNFQKHKEKHSILLQRSFNHQFTGQSSHECHWVKLWTQVLKENWSHQWRNLILLDLLSFIINIKKSLKITRVFNCINFFHATGFFFYPLKISESLILSWCF